MRFAICVFMIVAILLWTESACAECPQTTTLVQLRRACEKGEQAFAGTQLTELLKVATQARNEMIPCLRDALTPMDGARFHRLLALEAYTLHNEHAVVREFHAARKLDTGYVLPEALASSEDHPLNVYYHQAAQQDDGRPELIYVPQGGFALVDGIKNAPRMSLVSAVVQVYAVGGVWIETRYVRPGEKLPIWGKNVFGITAHDLGIDMTPGWKKPGPWYVAAGTSAAFAIIFYALAMHEKTVFKDHATADSDLSVHRDRANGFGATAVTATGLTMIFTGLAVGFQYNWGAKEAPTLTPVTFNTTHFAPHPTFGSVDDVKD